jgi:hypothetical protein
VTVFDSIDEAEVEAKAEQVEAEAVNESAVVDPIEEKLAAEFLPVSDEATESENQAEENTAQADDETVDKEA